MVGTKVSEIQGRLGTLSRGMAVQRTHAQSPCYQKDAESSWGEPERVAAQIIYMVADCTWDVHTDMQLFVQPDYYGYTGMG